jgi:hypothetical protein
MDDDVARKEASRLGKEGKEARGNALSESLDEVCPATSSFASFLGAILDESTSASKSARMEVWKEV